MQHGVAVPTSRRYQRATDMETRGCLLFCFRKGEEMKQIVRPIGLDKEEDDLLRLIANERASSISSVIRWAINKAVRPEAERLAGANKSGAEVSQAPGAAL